MHIQTLKIENNIFININTSTHYIKFGSQFSPPSGNLEEDFLSWSQQITDCNNLILGGNFNAYLQAWGYNKNIIKGELLLDYISQNAVKNFVLG